MERATAQIARTGRFHAVRRAAAVPLAQRPTRHILIRNRLGITRHVSSPALLTDPRARTATIRHELSFLNVFRLVQSLVYIGLARAGVLGWWAPAVYVVALVGMFTVPVSLTFVYGLTFTALFAPLAVLGFLTIRRTRLPRPTV